MSVTPELKPRKQKVVTEHRRHEKDNGSSEVQIALLTERIGQITEHLKTHRTDFSSQRGLRKMVGRRTALLQYLQRNDHKRYASLVKRLGLRK